jgi:hypothetical protein
LVNVPLSAPTWKECGYLNHEPVSSGTSIVKACAAVAVPSHTKETHIDCILHMAFTFV